MECDKCKSKNIKIIECYDTIETNIYSGEQYWETTIIIKCEDCGYEFEEYI